MKTKWFLTLVLAVASMCVIAETIEPNQYAIWGIEDSQIVIPAGSVVTEAVLTIENIAESNEPLYVHLLDNTTPGFTVEADNAVGNVFDGFGVPLTGTYENGNYVCRLSQISDPQSRIWQVFAQPCTMALADGSTAQFSSGLLELMDYLGNGGGVGIGIDNGTGVNIDYNSINLDMTVQSYQDQIEPQTVSLSYPHVAPIGNSVYALRFDGVDDTVDLNCTALTNTFTVSAWVKATTTHQIDKESTTGYSGTSGQRYLFGCTRAAGADDAGMGVSVGTNGISVYELRAGYMPALAVYSGNLGTGWNHIAVTYTDRKPRIYLNGVLVRTGLVSPRSVVLSSIQIGGSKDCLTYGLFPGTVTDVSVWGYARTQTQIKEEMTAGLSGAEVGLTGYWRFNEGRDVSAFDSSANDHTGTVHGAVWVSDSPKRKLLQLDGVDDIVDLNYAALTNTFTISAWVKATTTHQIDKEGATGYLGTSGQRYLFGCTRAMGTDDAGMGVSVGTNGISVYELRSGYMPALAVYSGNLGTGWNHIAVTYTDRRPRIYLNGVLVRTGTVSPRSIVLSSIQVGGSKDCLSYGLFPGTVADVSVWNYARSLQQVKEEVAAGLTGTEAGLAGYWKLNEGIGGTAFDSSGNNNNAMILSGTWFEGVKQ